MSGEKVVPDQYYTPAVDQWRGGKIALFERSTILRVLDEEIAELEESRIDTFALRSIRSRFSTEGGGS